VRPLPPASSPPEPAANPREPVFRIPSATGWLIAVNLLIQIVRSFLPAGQDEIIIDTLGFDPASLYGPARLMTPVTLVSYQFLHGGWNHLAINMVSLLAFGAGVEKPLGPARFLVLYIVSGIAGGLLESLFVNATGNDLLIGASASISGIFGALLILWGINRRGSRPMGMVPMALLWIALMMITGILGVGAGGSPVAWIAHIGGFLAGIGFGLVFRQGFRRD